MDELASQIERLRREIISPSVRDGLDYWVKLLAGRPFPARRELDPTAIPRQLLRITLVDVTYDPLDFRLRLVGQHVRDRMGATAHTRVADTVKPDQGLDRLLRRYRLCAEQRRPIRGLFQFIPLLPPRDPIWVEAVSCPLSDEQPDRVDNIVTFASDGDFKVLDGAPEVP